MSVDIVRPEGEKQTYNHIDQPRRYVRLGCSTLDLQIRFLNVDIDRWIPVTKAEKNDSILATSTADVKEVLRLSV